MRVVGDVRAGQEARVEDAHIHDAGAALHTAVKQRNVWLLQQGVAAGKHQEVQVGGFDALQRGFGGVGAHANRRDQAFGTQLFQGRQAVFDSGLQVVDVGVVQVRDVHMAKAEPLQGLLNTATDAGLGEVPNTTANGRNVETFGIPASGPVGFQQAPHLGGDDEFLPRLVPQDSTEPLFGQAQSVMRRGIEVADPGVPRRKYRGEGFPIRKGPVEIPYARSAETELAQIRCIHGSSHTLPIPLSAPE
ncbi:hypothetical protein PJL18_03090 [Paenarthrobacter nicotinovorans]|nr:hypothetical protein [Paenarthrobacter nicotinovorans]